MTTQESSVQPVAPSWMEVRSKEDAELLLSRTRGFHDAVMRIAHLDSGSYVNTRLELLEKAFSSLWILVQTQWDDAPAVELLFAELERFEFDRRYERHGTVKPSSGGYEMVFGGWKVRAAKLYFRFGSTEDLGPYPKAFNEADLPKSLI